MLQDSDFSPVLFVIVMEVIYRQFTDTIQWKLLFMDDLAVIAESLFSGRTAWRVKT